MNTPASWQFVPDIEGGPVVFRPSSSTLLDAAHFEYSIELKKRLLPSADATSAGKDPPEDPLQANCKLIDEGEDEVLQVDGDAPDTSPDVIRGYKKGLVSEEFKNRAISMVAFYEGRGSDTALRITYQSWECMGCFPRLGSDCPYLCRGGKLFPSFPSTVERTRIWTIGLR